MKILYRILVWAKALWTTVGGKKFQPDDTLQLVLEAETEEEKSFYEMVGDFLLQREQK